MVSVKRKASPRAAPASGPSLAFTAVWRSTSGFRSVSTRWASQRSSRACTRSRAVPVSASSASTITRGRSTSSPAASRPTGAPCQRRVPSSASVKSPLAEAPSRVARRSISGAKALAAAARVAFWSGPSPVSAEKRKPCSSPTA